MKIRRQTFLIAVIVALIGAWSVVGFAAATPASGVTSAPIAAGNLGEMNFVVKNGEWMTHLRTKGQTDVAVVENRVAPGGSFGWHSHPGPSLIIVKQGVITFYRADDPTCTPQVYRAGDAFIDEGTDVHVGINNGTEELIVIVTRFLPDGAKARDDADDPQVCGI
jgi:quercetin dioxygenase-like cupin family protein